MKKIIFFVVFFYLMFAQLLMGWLQAFPETRAMFNDYQFAFWLTHGFFFAIALCIGGYNDWYRN